MPELKLVKVISLNLLLIYCFPYIFLFLYMYSLLNDVHFYCKLITTFLKNLFRNWFKQKKYK